MTYTDPDEGCSTGIFTVVRINGEVLTLDNGLGQTLEAWAHEVA